MDAPRPAPEAPEAGPAPVPVSALRSETDAEIFEDPPSPVSVRRPETDAEKFEDSPSPVAFREIGPADQRPRHIEHLNWFKIVSGRIVMVRGRLVDVPGIAGATKWAWSPVGLHLDEVRWEESVHPADRADPPSNVVRAEPIAEPAANAEN